MPGTPPEPRFAPSGSTKPNTSSHRRERRRPMQDKPSRLQLLPGESLTAALSDDLVECLTATAKMYEAEGNEHEAAKFSSTGRHGPGRKRPTQRGVRGHGGPTRSARART